MNSSNRKIVNERLRPRLWHYGYLGMKPLLEALICFSAQLKKEDKYHSVLDLGCGIKPYRSLFESTEKYIGFDIEENDEVDVVGLNWNLPFEENEFDALISTQVLEHTAKITETVAEIKRVVKPEGLIYISVPLTFPEHGIPHDFYRFTRYGLMEVFKDFEIIYITPHNGYLATLIRLWNVFLIYIPGSYYIFLPVFFINNSLALLLDGLAKLFSKLSYPIIKEAYDKVYMGMTESYSILLRNKK